LALAGDGNTLVVGADGEDSGATGIGGDQTDNSAVNSGAVYVFTRIGGVWSQQAYVKASNTEEEDRFGTSLAIAGDGNTLAVGAYAEDSSAIGIDGDQTDNSGFGSGAVYVFNRISDAWSQEAYVKASNTGDGDGFGSSLTMAGDGNTLAVGAMFEDSGATGIGGDQTDNSVNNSGAAYVYTHSGGVWFQQAYVKASNTGSDNFGMSLTLNLEGNILAIAAWLEDSAATGIDGDQTDNSASYSGAAYLY
jgi:hypothetical protein